MIEIKNYQSFTNSLVQRLSVYEHELEKNKIIIIKDEKDWSKSTNFLFKDYGSGQLKSLAFSEFTIGDFKRIELELKNRQYQLLLLNAFEAFEKYLKWAKSCITTNSSKQKTERFSPTKFIITLHKTIPVISTIIKSRNENNPEFLDEINLFLTFSLIEQLRHQITHTSGYAEDKSIFIKNCLERIGRYSNGKPKSGYTDYLNRFFGTKKYENLICLIELRDKENPFYYYDRLGDLIKELASYIVFIHGYIKSTSDVAISVEPLAAPSA